MGSFVKLFQCLIVDLDNDGCIRNEYRGSYVATGIVETNEFSCYISVFSHNMIMKVTIIQ